MKYAILTFGCRVNQADSFDLDVDLRAAGGEEVPVERADLVVVNTCAVTAIAEQAARQAIRRAVRLNPTARVVATGCYAVRRPADFVALSAVTRLRPSAGTLGDIGRPRAVPQHQPVAAPDFSLARRGRLPAPGTQGRTRFLLRVQTGCDERCAYCVVPATRGPSRSTPLDAVVSRVSAAAEAGYREVVITGVHLGSWGRDLSPSRGLGDLVGALADHPSDVRFRLSSVEPMDMDAGVVERLGRAPRFAPQFHLPLQQASDRLLAAMRRPYTLAAFDGTVGRLRTAFPDAAITTDLIVGFPGEREEDFQSCERYLATSPLTGAHVFPFSPRPGTDAEKLGGLPRAADVRRRVTALRAIAADRSRQFRDRFVRSTRAGLTIADGSLVLTDNGLKVRVGTALPRNERVRVRICENGDPMRGVVESAAD